MGFPAAHKVHTARARTTAKLAFIAGAVPTTAHTSTIRVVVQKNKKEQEEEGEEHKRDTNKTHTRPDFQPPTPAQKSRIEQERERASKKKGVKRLCETR